MPTQTGRTTQGRVFGRVVVLGGSLAGLLAARVLAEHAAEVVIIERDEFPDTPAPRRGVPQARHAHGLLARGYRQLERWFPGLGERLAARGAVFADLGADAHWWHFDGLKVRFPSDLRGPFLSRALLDDEVRQRLVRFPNLAFLGATEVRELQASRGGTRITGVVVEAREGGARRRRTIAADLVVDATGRGSQLPAWIAALGYEKPVEERVTIDAGYTSRFYRRQDGDLPGARVAYALPTPPHATRMGALFPVDGERWLVSLGGWSGDHAEPDEAAFLAFARSLPIPEIARVVARATPVSEFAVYRFPASQRRHYERLSRFPDGLLAIGDAICSFNPIYGQGMTVSVMEAEALDAVLTKWGRDSFAGSPTPRNSGHVARRYFRQVARIVDVPWSLAVLEDFRFPETTGRRPPGLGLIHRYTERVHHAAQRDPVVCLAFYNVMNLLAPPASLFHPRVALRLAWLAATGRSGPTNARVAGPQTSATAGDPVRIADRAQLPESGEARTLGPRPLDSGPIATTGP